MILAPARRLTKQVDSKSGVTLVTVAGVPCLLVIDS